MTILKTSTIWVLSSTHRLLRQINYSRREVGNEIKPLIQIQGYDARGQLSRLVDARFSEGYLQKPKTTNPNYKQLSTLSGVVLRSESVDAGMRFGLSDVRGNALYGIDSRETEQTYEYDGIGRLIACFEAEKGQERVCKERFVYGGKETKGMNGIHRLVQHYDTAGMEGIVNYTIQGKVTTQKRQFLQASAKVDWTQGFKGLEEAVYETGWNYNGLGEVLAQTDAKGNVQHSRYAVSGQLETSTMQLKGKEEQVVVRGIGYAANGQVLQKEYSNGIRVHYHYESRTQRLRQLESIRLKDNKQLQDLRYVYDPVGNILEVRDKSKGTGFYANGKTESVSHYRYDSLYQLIEASGIESQLAGRETSQLPQEIAFGNKDASRCVNYKRVYQYDAGGNLVEMQHQGASQYTQRIEIDATSNRGLEAGSKRTFKESFDGNGNVLYLVTEPLKWDGKNQLSEVTQIVRKTLSDKESYRYDGSGQRIEKLTQRIAESQLHYERVRYLPGLELRERWQTDLAEENKKLTEELHVIQMQDSRVLHWENEKPEEISNDDLRYSLTDQLGSIQLELNSAGKLISYESYYPYGGTAIWSTRNRSEVNYKFVRYSGKERDSTGLYYYGYRYYAPWLCRWLNPDPSGIEQGLNFYQMVDNNPITFIDNDGRGPTIPIDNAAQRLTYSIYYEKRDVVIEIPEYLFKGNALEKQEQKEAYGKIAKKIAKNIDTIASSKEYIEKPAFEDLNFTMLDEDPIREYSTKPDDFQGQANADAREDLNEALEKLRPENGRVVFRGGLAAVDAYSNRIQIGNYVSNRDWFLSTSRKVETPIKAIFTGQNAMPPNTESIFFVINTLSGRSISQWSVYPEEEEILHLTDRNFLVTWIQEPSMDTNLSYQGTRLYPKYVFLSEVEGPFLHPDFNLAKNIYTGE